MHSTRPASTSWRAAALSAVPVHQGSIGGGSGHYRVAYLGDLDGILVQPGGPHGSSEDAAFPGELCGALQRDERTLKAAEEAKTAKATAPATRGR